MRNLLLVIILGTLVSACQTTGNHQPVSINDKVDNIQLTIIYEGELVGEHTGIEQDNDSYMTKLTISSQATIAELIDAFHKQTGLAKTNTFGYGAPPNRQTTEIPYWHRVNGQVVNEDNESDKLNDWNITNHNTINIVIGGGGGLD